MEGANFCSVPCHDAPLLAYVLFAAGCAAAASKCALRACGRRPHNPVNVCVSATMECSVVTCCIVRY
eukprot:758541-Pelagomonas_calceolata.AAC.3